jgi:alcohol dehydrogenase class IV
VAEAMGLDVRGLDDDAAGLAAADAVAAFAGSVGLPGSLAELGVPEDDLAACAEAALSDGAIVYNAVPVTDPADTLAVLRAAWKGAA